jgi:hypothetical protein
LIGKLVGTAVLAIAAATVTALPASAAGGAVYAKTVHYADSGAIASIDDHGALRAGEALALGKNACAIGISALAPPLFQSGRAACSVPGNGEVVLSTTPLNDLVEPYVEPAVVEEILAAS